MKHEKDINKTISFTAASKTKQNKTKKPQIPWESELTKKKCTCVSKNC